jgi:hypothetical protein
MSNQLDNRTWAKLPSKLPAIMDVPSMYLSKSIPMDMDQAS